MEFLIDISGKVATVVGTPIIVCGNKDYTIRFTFSLEWLGAATKTARFVWMRNGEQHYEDVVFTGNTVAVPLLTDITTVQVGVYAGDLKTTTPARIPCVKSILCGGGTHEEPTPDVYAQLIALIEENAVQTPVTLAVEERKSGEPFTFWLGTQAEYDALPTTERVEGCLYIITDDGTYADFQEELGGFEERLDGFDLKLDDVIFGEIVPYEAGRAGTAGYGALIQPTNASGSMTWLPTNNNTRTTFLADFTQGWYVAEIELAYVPDENADARYYGARFKTKPFSFSTIGEQEEMTYGEPFFFATSTKSITGNYSFTVNITAANALRMKVSTDSSITSPQLFGFRLVGIHRLEVMK